MAFKLQKYFYAFGICVGVPCLVLAYMAYRGIRNDQALMDQEIERIHKQVLFEVEKGLTTYSENVENALSADVGKPQPFFDQYILIDSTVSCIFNLKESGQSYFYPPLLYQLFTHTQGSTGILPKLQDNPLLQQAQQSEFQKLQFDRAIQCYLELGKKVHDSSDLSIILMALARNYQKSRRYEAALETLRRVKTLSGQQKDQTETPVGLLAAVAACDVLESLNREQSRCDELFDIYEKMLTHHWQLSESGFNFYSAKIFTALQTLLTTENVPHDQNELFKLDSLRNLEKIKRHYTEQITEFQTIFYQTQANLQNPALSQPAWTRHEILAGQRHYAVSLKKLSGKSGWNYMGILWEPQKLCQRVYKNLKGNVISDVIQGLQITDFDGSQFYQTGNHNAEMILMNQSISADYFPWKIITYRKQEPFLNRMFTGRRSIYFMIFILIGGVLCFSFIFFSRAMHTELEFLELRTRFVTTVSHEFKSPLTAIIQLAELLDSKRVKTLAKRQLYYQIILEQSRKLSSLIDNLLNFSRLRQKQWTYYFEEIAVAPFLQEAVQRFRERLKGGDWQIKLRQLKKGATIRGDRLALEIVMNNLIDNAVKYSGSIHKVEIILTSHRKMIQMNVRDFGIGMSAGEVDKIFHEFYRGNSPAMKTIRGSGLGLAIAQQIIADHLGRITVKSMAGQGSTFIVELPLIEIKG
jgi:signal transduction histidine kinase